MIWNEIVCLGDSLTYGARDRYGRSYPAELGKILSEETKEFYICHNYGINGETSSDLLRRSWNILKSHAGAKICLLLIGTNDTKTPMPLDIYRDNLRQIISSYYKLNREYVDKYNKVIKEMSKEMNFMVCELDGLAPHLIDGVHFTHEGYKEVAKRWAKAIMSLS